jgi:diketogulonate reductase-like aldo/keto reductase
MTLKLNSGFEMPSLGFGTSGIKTTEPFYSAIKVGYRHFDTASKYGNEEFLGEALTRAIQEGLVKREDLFITTKLWFTEFNDPKAAIQRSLEKLKTDYADLYLIHWPMNGVIENKVPMHVLWA